MCSTGNQFLLQVTSRNLSSREPVGGFLLFLKGQYFESEPHQDSSLCFQDGQLILLGLSHVPRGATLVSTFHSFLNSFSRSWYLSIFSVSFSSTLASPGTATSIIWQTDWVVCLLQLGQSYCVEPFYIIIIIIIIIDAQLFFVGSIKF